MAQLSSQLEAVVMESDFALTLRGKISPVTTLNSQLWVPSEETVIDFPEEIVKGSPGEVGESFPKKEEAKLTRHKDPRNMRRRRYRYRQRRREPIEPDGCLLARQFQLRLR